MAVRRVFPYAKWSYIETYKENKPGMSKISSIEEKFS